MTQYYTALIAFAVFTMLILSGMVWKNDALSKRIKRGIIVSAVLIIIAACCEYLGVVLNGGAANLRTLHMIVKFLELSLAPAIPLVFGHTIHPAKAHRLLSVLLVPHTLLEFVSMWLGLTFFVDANNVYVHCSLYFIYYAAYFLGIVFLIVQVIGFSRRYQSQNRVSLFMIMGFILLGIFWQVFDSATRVVWLAVAMGNMMFYIYYCDILQQTDNLTQLLNRRNYDNCMKLAHRPAVIVMADVDDFKAVNDRSGHLFGDVCLSEVGGALMSAYGRYGKCYRIGGDEFCVVLERGLDCVEKMNDAFRDSMDARRRAEPNLPFVSIGYAAFDPSAMTVQEALRAADQMMYAAKQEAKRGAGSLTGRSGAYTPR